MPKWLGWTALGLYLVVVLSAVLAGWLAPRPATAEVEASAPPVVANITTTPRIAASRLDEQMIGFALNVHHIDRIDRYFEAIDRMASMGINAVEIITPIYQRDGAATDLGIDPDRCPTPEQLQWIIGYARSKGMRVMLMPIVLLRQPRGNEWRGKLHPDNWDQWWEQYTVQMLSFAELAQEAGADVFAVGSELLSTETQTERWTKLIEQVRQHFGGKLTYSTNWDHYQTPTFWNQLDMIGINGYWEITSDPEAPLPKLVQRWEKIQADVVAFSQRIGRPVLFTEIGYPSLPWALKDPWNYIPGDKESTPQVQLKGYQAFLEAWEGLLRPRTTPAERRMAGVFFYEWDVFYQGGPKDTGYGVRGKPALDLISEWLATRNELPTEAETETDNAGSGRG